MGFELGLGEKKKSTKALAGKYKEAKESLFSENILKEI